MIYLQTEKNIKVTRQQVYLEDVAELSGNDKAQVQRCRKLKVKELPRGKYGRYTMDVIELVRLIEQNEENTEVTHMGEPRFLLTYEKTKKDSGVCSWIKTIFVGMIVFFGTAFSIMTFHTDVDIPVLFHHIYHEVTGNVSDGFTVLEISYSIGIGLGVVLFFNHFGKFRISGDPTPMDVEMWTYEDQVNDTVMEKESREET